MRQGGLWEICESFLSLWLTNDYDDGNDVESDGVNVWVFVRVCVCVCVCVYVCLIASKARQGGKGWWEIFANQSLCLCKVHTSLW